MNAGQKSASPTRAFKSARKDQRAGARSAGRTPHTRRIFEVLAHLGYGLLVIPFVVRFAAASSRSPATASSAARPAGPTVT